MDGEKKSQVSAWLDLTFPKHVLRPGPLQGQRQNSVTQILRKLQEAGLCIPFHQERQMNVLSRTPRPGYPRPRGGPVRAPLTRAGKSLLCWDQLVLSSLAIWLQTPPALSPLWVLCWIFMASLCRGRRRVLFPAGERAGTGAGRRREQHCW